MDIGPEGQHGPTNFQFRHGPGRHPFSLHPASESVTESVSKWECPKMLEMMRRMMTRSIGFYGTPRTNPLWGWCRTRCVTNGRIGDDRCTKNSRRGANHRLRYSWGEGASPKRDKHIAFPQSGHSKNYGKTMKCGQCALYYSVGFGIVLCTAISRWSKRLRDPCLTVKESTTLGKELFTGDVQRAQAFTFEHFTFFNCHRMPSHHLTNRFV